MSSMNLSCPYCNAYVTVPDRVINGQRIPCPRCGEAFSYRGEAQQGSSGEGPVPAATMQAPPRSGLSNKKLAAMVLAVMFVMACIGLWWALRTVPDRRLQDPRGPLGYLPADVNLIASVNVRQALDAPAGHQFLNELGVGNADVSLTRLENWTGLKREVFSQLVLGLKLDDRLVPRVTLVVQTRFDYDVEALRKALGVQRTADRKGKQLGLFTLSGKLPLDMELWCPTRTIFVLGLREDLDAVPDEPANGIEHFAPPLTALLRDPLGDHTQAWLIAHSTDWSKTPLPLLLIQLPAEEQKPLLKIDTWGIAVAFDKTTAKINAAAHVDSEAASIALKEYLQRVLKLSPDEVTPRKSNWLMLQTETDPSSLRSSLRKGLAR